MACRQSHMHINRWNGNKQQPSILQRHILYPSMIFIFRGILCNKMLATTISFSSPLSLCLLLFIMCEGKRANDTHNRTNNAHNSYIIYNNSKTIVWSTNRKNCFHFVICALFIESIWSFSIFLQLIGMWQPTHICKTILYPSLFPNMKKCFLKEHKTKHEEEEEEFIRLLLLRILRILL